MTDSAIIWLTGFLAISCKKYTDAEKLVPNSQLAKALDLDSKSWAAQQLARVRRNFCEDWQNRPLILKRKGTK